VLFQHISVFNLDTTEQAGVAVTLWLFIDKAPGSDIRRDTVCWTEMVRGYLST
jgi:hypothetical protein